MEKVNIIETIKQLGDAWDVVMTTDGELDILQINAIRHAKIILERLEQAGEESIEFYGNDPE